MTDLLPTVETVYQSDISGLFIRAPKMEDVAGLIEMRAQPSIVSDANTLWPELYTTTNISSGISVARVSLDTTPVLVAVLQDGGVERLVGHVSLRREYYRKTHIGEVMLFVHEKFRGRGIGNCLAKMIVGVGRAISLHESNLFKSEQKNPPLQILQAEIHADNHGGQSFVEKFGFERVGVSSVLAVSWRNEPKPTIVYQLSL